MLNYFVNDGHFGYFTKSIEKTHGYNMPMMLKAIKKLCLKICSTFSDTYGEKAL